MTRRKRTTRHPSGAPRHDPPGAAAPAAPAGPRVTVAIALALIALTVLAYSPVWRFDFVAIDDPQYVYANPHIALHRGHSDPT